MQVSELNHLECVSFFGLNTGLLLACEAVAKHCEHHACEGHEKCCEEQHIGPAAVAQEHALADCLLAECIHRILAGVSKRLDRDL